MFAQVGLYGQGLLAGGGERLAADGGAGFLQLLFKLGDAFLCLGVGLGGFPMGYALLQLVEELSEAYTHM